MSIKEICEEVQISEGTFFNYFPKKNDILNYFIALWSIEVKFYINELDQEKPLEAIENAFIFTCSEGNPPK